MNSIEKELTATLPMIKWMGVMLFDPIWATRMHRASDAEFIHVLDGVLECELATGTVAARPGDTIVLAPGQLHRDGFDLNKGIKLFFCTFSWPLTKAYFKLVKTEAFISLSPAGKAEMATMIDQLRGDLSRSGSENEALARSRLLTLLLMGWRAGRDESAKAKPRRPGASLGKTRQLDLFENARQYLDVHYAEQIDLDTLAQKLGVSGYHLSHVFSQESEFSLFEYLTTVRISKAQALLRDGKVPVADAARACGYDDPNYFAKVFRKYTRMSPRDFAAKGPKPVRK